jgi:hypothetical protein
MANNSGEGQGSQRAVVPVMMTNYFQKLMNHKQAHFGSIVVGCCLSILQILLYLIQLLLFFPAVIRFIYSHYYVKQYQ